MRPVLILVRHAHRSLKNRAADNGLSKKGREQRKYLTRSLAALLPRKAKILLISSPKKRCVETLEKFAKTRRKKIQIENRLNEGSPRARTAALLKELKTAQTELVLACTHGDILPVMLKDLGCPEIEISKGSFVILKKTKSSPFKLQWLVKPARSALK